MKMRVPVAALVALAMFLTACGDDGDSALDRVGNEASQVDDAVDDVSNDDDSDAQDAPADDPADDESDDDDSDDDNGTSMPSLENLGDCFTVSLTYGSLALASLGGLMGGGEISDADKKELEKSIAELRGELPKEIQDDFAVVAEAYGTAMKEGFMSQKAMKALESKEFEKADANIQKYLEELCG